MIERLDNGYRNYADCQQNITRLPSEFARNFWYDSCSFFPPFIEMVRQFAGTEKILFGTDYPFIDLGSEHLDGMTFTAEERAAIMGGNARQLFGI